MIIIIFESFNLKYILPYEHEKYKRMYMYIIALKSLQKYTNKPHNHIHK